METSVLIVIPTLGKRNGMLEECINSIQNQNFQPTVVIAFPEKSSNSLKEIKIKYPNLNYEICELDMISTINYVMQKYSNHMYANWLGDDDQLVPYTLHKGLQILNGNTKLIGVYGGCVYIDSTGREVARYRPLSFSNYLIGIIPAAIKLEGGLFRLKEFNNMGGIDPRYKLCPDVYVTLKLRKFGKWARSDQEFLSKFRIHSDSITAKTRKKGIQEARIIQLQNGKVWEILIVRIFGKIFQEIKLLTFWIIEKKSKL